MRLVYAWIAVMASLLTCRVGLCQPTVLDGFESADGWKVITADGVTLSVQPDEGVHGRCLRLDYDFVSGAGYCIIQKPFAIKLPGNYEFTFQLRGDGPANNLEFKLLDQTGDNVWWDIRRALEWPRRWTRMIDKKRRIEFAWGPSGGAPLAEASKIEFAISSSSGGKGSVWLDELTFRELPPESHEPLRPTASASVTAGAEFGASNVLDGNPKTLWRSGPLHPGDHPVLTLDLGRVAEVGGLDIDWEAAPAQFDVESSDDAANWTRLVEHQPHADTTIVPTPDAEARYLRLVMTHPAAGDAVAVREVRVRPTEFAASPNAMFAALAAESPRGRYPRCFSNEQSYWTVIGADGDDAEALINEEGAVELCKRGPTLEPFITMNGKLSTWADSKNTQSLERGYLPVPSVDRVLQTVPLGLTITAFVDGPPGASLLWVTYRVRNLGPLDAPTLRGRLHVALRPFQVNPPWQRLNNEGGFAPLTVVDPSGVDGHPALTFNRAFGVVALGAPARAGAASFECGDVSEWLSSARPTVQSPLEDPDGRASGEIAFDFEARGGVESEYTLVVPMHGAGTAPLPPGADAVGTRRDACIKSWDEKVSRAGVTVPKKDQWIADTFKSQLAYILINRDGPAIQPGSRSYERSWARDGSMTSAALLSCGHPEEVRAWIDWFGSHQFESGKVPCVVDNRGPDPVPEYDSNGEYIWAVANYFRYTHDQGFLKVHWPRVQKAVAFIKSLRAQRMTTEYAGADSPKRAFYGLVPESISHEGYSAKPMHSYWDDFFVLLGLKEAAYLAGQAGDSSAEAAYKALAADFRSCLYDSMRLAMADKHIDYIPGCVELGDFDSTSTTIALFPCDELDGAPEPALRATFDRYWSFFQARRSPLSAWDAFTPYEVRHVGAFVRLGQPERAYEALSWFHQYQRPGAWNHWAEVVWHDPLTPKFIGDMPHTWVGSDYLNSVCSMFVYEHADSTVVFAGVPRAWVVSGEEVGFTNIVTTRGPVSGSLQLKNGAVHVKVWATGPWAPGDIIIRKPPGARGQDAVVSSLPAQVSFEYPP